jgi:hypothetical protein
MQGDKIGEESGKVIVRRVLPNPGGPKVEVSAQTEGSVLGVKSVNAITYTSGFRPDGTLYGEGQGFIMGEGGERATWVGQGVGTIKNDRSVSYRGAIYYQSSSPKWSKLNSVAGIFEHEVDSEGNIHSKTWEWK